jgi:hypothetical protein
MPESSGGEGARRHEPGTDLTAALEMGGQQAAAPSTPLGTHDATSSPVPMERCYAVRKLEPAALTPVERAARVGA